MTVPSSDEDRFRWRPVLLATPAGVLFATLTIAGALPDAGSTQWVALGLIAVIALWIAVNVPRASFRHGLAAGFMAALIAIEAQALFIGTYFSNNPQYADLTMPFGWPPRVATAVLGPLNALLAGVIVGSLAWTIGLWTRRVAPKRTKI